MAYQLLSLFCGAGGLDHGFRQGGFETVLALDKCPQAVRSFNANSRGADIAKEADLSSLDEAGFLSLVPYGCRPVGLIGGPPCQGFSRGNVSADPADPRNRLPFRYVDLLAAANRKFQLHFFVFENVAELAGPKHRLRFGKVMARLKRAGFEVFRETLNAADTVYRSDAGDCSSLASILIATEALRSTSRLEVVLLEASAMQLKDYRSRGIMSGV